MSLKGKFYVHLVQQLEEVRHEGLNEQGKPRLVPAKYRTTKLWPVEGDGEIVLYGPIGAGAEQPFEAGRFYDVTIKLAE